MSDHPRTDAEAKIVHGEPFVYAVPASFARQLERELNAAQSEIESVRNGAATACKRLRDEMAIDAECRKLERETYEAEIARLRANTGCARNQTTTQFCHEAVDANKLRVDAEWERDKWRKVADRLAASVHADDPSELFDSIAAYDAAAKEGAK